MTKEEAFNDLVKGYNEAEDKDEYFQHFLDAISQNGLFDAEEMLLVLEFCKAVGREMKFV